MKARTITRTVWVLSLISLFTDTASEMLYPVMPIYLKEIGFSVLLIGVLEGFAEAIAGLSKGWFGQWSDATGRRAPFVQFGYALSSVSKPMMGLLVAPAWIFFARTIDRLGKGIRTGARDAMLSDEARAGTKARVFGFHRSMDTLGAVIGPVLALLYLHFHPKAYQTLFLLAFAPSVVAIIASFLLRDRSLQPRPAGKAGPFFGFLRYWKTSPTTYRRLVTGLLLFALFNSSDVFLLLQARNMGLSDTQCIGSYIFYNLVYAVFAFPMGSLADHIGVKRVLLGGLALFIAVYAGMAIGGGLWFLALLFALYGVYAAATEGIAKAWITQITDKRDTATAIGTYAGFQSICALLASVFAGLLWFAFGPAITFAVTAMATLLVVVLLIRMKDPSLPTEV